MARILGVGRTSASPSLENKEEHERDVVLNQQDADRWEKTNKQKVGNEGNRHTFFPEGGKRVIHKGW